MSERSELETVRDCLVERLQGRNDLAGVTILARETGNVLSRVNEKLASVGVVVVVDFLGADIRQHQTRRPYMLARYAIDIAEDVELNQSSGGLQKPALYIAERVVAEVHMLAISLPGRREVFRTNTIEEIEPGRSKATYGLSVTGDINLIITPRSNN